MHSSLVFLLDILRHAIFTLSLEVEWTLVLALRCNSGIRDTVQLVKTLERPLTERK